MSDEFELHRGTSQFEDRRELGPNGDTVDVIRRRPDRHSRVVYDASAPRELTGLTEAEIRAKGPLSDSPKKNARLMGKAISEAQSRVTGPKASRRP